MGRYTGPKCRLCRREGQKLFLKGLRCETKKCAISKRDQAPGMHVFRRGRGKPSAYSMQLREKQKVKRLYGIYERQFRIYFQGATKSRGNTGETLLVTLERRLDNVLFRCGYALSRTQARQFISHGHVKVNGRKVSIPSYLVKSSDLITANREKSERLFRESLEISKATAPTWLSVSESPIEVRVASMPTRDEITDEIAENLIVEFCSK